VYFNNDKKPDSLQLNSIGEKKNTKLVIHVSSTNRAVIKCKIESEKPTPAYYSQGYISNIFLQTKSEQPFLSKCAYKARRFICKKINNIDYNNNVKEIDVLIAQLEGKLQLELSLASTRHQNY